MIRTDNLDELVMVRAMMMVMKRRMRMNFIIRTDKLGESREEAKNLLDEVEAMEREAHQVVSMVVGIIIIIIIITIIRGTHGGQLCHRHHTPIITPSPSLNKFSSSPLYLTLLCRFLTDV